MAHLKGTIKPKARDLTWVNAAVTEPSMLTYYSEATLGFIFRGTSDVAICTGRSVLDMSPELGLKVLLELKKLKGREAFTQARATLLLANLHSPEERPIVVRPQVALLEILIVLEVIRTKICNRRDI